MLEKIEIPAIPADFPFPISSDDIDYRLAVRAYSATSHSPERRAQMVVVDYLNRMVDLWRELFPEPFSEEKYDLLIAELKRYRDGYLKHTRLCLEARSRCMSPFIVGPAKFPTARNQKRLSTEEKRTTEFAEWEARAITAIKKKLAPAPEPAEDRLASLEKQRDLMKAINAEYRKCKGDIDAMQIPGDALKATMKKTRESYWLGRDNYKPFEAFELTSINAKIKRLQSNVAAEEARTQSPVREAVVGDVTIVDNPDADRYQVMFPGKPSAEMIGRLKGSGFRWTPSVGAWQGYRNNRTLWKLEEIFGKFTF